MERGRSAGIDLFLEDGAYTTLTSAVSILVILSLLFAIASGIWSMSRAGDTQVAADATALAGANVVSSYHTAATVLDASVLSMGLAGLCVTGAGLVGLLIPGVNAVAPQTVNAGLRMLEARNKLAASASKGLKALESSLPFVIAANGTRACAAQGSDEVVFTGTALAVPLSSGSDFPALEGEQVSTEGIENAAGELDEAAQELAAAAEETAKAKEEAWLADCGSEGRNMQERAGKLSALSGTENPDYASSITWEPEVALNRTRSYYAWRLEHDEPENASVEAAADSAARKAFYRYAVDHFRSAHVVESGGRVTSTVELLPRNTDEVRETTLYTESVWPTTREGSGFVLHYGEACPELRALLDRCDLSPMSRRERFANALCAISGSAMLEGFLLHRLRLTTAMNTICAPLPRLLMHTYHAEIRSSSLNGRRRARRKRPATPSMRRFRFFRQSGRASLLPEDMAWFPLWCRVSCLPRMTLTQRSPKARACRDGVRCPLPCSRPMPRPIRTTSCHRSSALLSIEPAEAVRLG